MTDEEVQKPEEGADAAPAEMPAEAPAEETPTEEAA
jgi:hypothetical protein